MQMMIQTCGQLMTFLGQAGMEKSKKALEEDLATFLRNQSGVTGSSEAENAKNSCTSVNLLTVIKKTVNSINSKQRQIDSRITAGGGGGSTANSSRNQSQKSTKIMSQEETEEIMEKLMNKLVVSPALLEDEKLNSKIEGFFDNTTFQRMVEATDVMRDIPNFSISNSFLLRDVSEPEQRKWHPGTKAFIHPPLPPPDHALPQKQEGFNKTDQSNNSWEDEQMLLNGGRGSQKGTTNNLMTRSDYQIDDLDNGGDNRTSVQAGGNQGYQMQFSSSNGGGADSQPNYPSQKQDVDLPHQDQSSVADQSASGFSVERAGEDFIPTIDEYTDDDDPGFELYEVPERDFLRVAEQLADKYDFPSRAVVNIPKKEGYDAHKEYQTPGQPGEIAANGQPVIVPLSEIHSSAAAVMLPERLRHPPSNDDYYPVQCDKIVYDSFNLRVIFDRERTGFEETKDFPIVINSIVAGRYQVMEYLGSAAFSKAIQCMDLVTNKVLCMKVIENNKDYFDQSVDEIKLLRFINVNCNPDEKNILRFYDYFYHKEHLFIVTELLQDNLYEFYKLNKESGEEKYFTVGRLQRIAQQMLVGIEYLHSLRLIHCDLKPENVLIKSRSRCEIKVIDFGSSCFIHDHLSSYVQSRSYRAPEVIIGCKYDYRIDMWSIGCILAELFTGNVLFQNDTVQGLLARVIGIIGPFPEWMIETGKLVSNFFTKERLLYMDVVEEGVHGGAEGGHPDSQKDKTKTGKIQILVPKYSNLKARMRTEDHMFLDFVRQCLQVDYTRRPTAKEALKHPWFTKCKYPDGL